jgi:hypothetical protein
MSGFLTLLKLLNYLEVVQVVQSLTVREQVNHFEKVA